MKSCYLFVLLIVMLSAECGSVKIIYEWSRRFFDFIGNSRLARKYISGGEPVTTQSLIAHQGYPVETHRVTTQDGYVLEMHRIPYGKTSNGHQRKKPPVIVFHGNAQSSADWVVNTPTEDALGFYLADSGYDVWLANQRGNDYSTRHVSMTAADAKFWDYSVHEIGVYDVPAMIDYITQHTGSGRVHFVGFSLSNAAVLVTLAKRPEYNNKIGVAVLMAPGVFFQGFLYGFARIAAPIASVYQVFSRFLGGLPILPHFVTNVLHRVLPVFCHPNVDVFGVCVIFFRVAFGNDFGLVGKEKISLITTVAPSPFSVKLAMHGLQQIGTGEFHEYDYGVSKNMRVYGRAEPPNYNLTNVRVPVSIFVGPMDFLASPKDARILAGRLPNLVQFHYVGNPVFRHLDFCYARGVGKLVYSNLVHTLDAFS